MALKVFSCVCHWRLCENYMEKWHRLLRVPDMSKVPTFDAAFRLAASSKQVHCIHLERSLFEVPVEDMNTLVYLDTTKLGVLSQPEVNAIGELVEKVLFRNPYSALALAGQYVQFTCHSGSALFLVPPLLFRATAGQSLRGEWRRLEDKLLTHKVELRMVVININTTDVHQNRDFPSAYPCFIGVPDCTLPSKGTAHRSLKGKDAEPSPVQVNVSPV